MKTKGIALALLAVCLLLGGCCLSHEWQPATCTAPATCAKCGKTEGEALPHIFMDADCVNPRTCNDCGFMEGDPLGHKWTDADCLNAKICNVCGEVEGEPLGHDWIAATCTESAVCAVCGTKEGTPLGHDYVELEVVRAATCTEKGETIEVCTICGNEKTVNTAVILHDYQKRVNLCTTTNTCKVCGYKKVVTVHSEWYFASVSHIDSSDYENRTLYGKLTCKCCRETKQGSLKFTDNEFEELFCKWLNDGMGSYDDLARYPEKQSQYVMRFTGYILQDCGDNCYRMATKGKYDNVIYVELLGKTDGRILEGDHVTVYGTPNLLYTYKSVSGAQITIPRFTAYYLHFI